MAMLKVPGLDTLPSLTGRIEEVENARADHLRELEKLDSLLARLKPEYNEIYNRSAPVASFPNEILSAIFEAGLLPQSQTREPPFEILVCQVTRRWRNVAIGTPSLWTNIVFSDKQPLDLVTSYMTRSRSIPLSIHMIISATDMEPIVRSIVPHARRWHSLRARFSVTACLGQLLKSLISTPPYYNTSDLASTITTQKTMPH